MSYTTHLIDQRFRVKTDQFVPAWKALLAKNHGVSHDFMGEHRPRTLVEVLDGVGLRAEVGEEGDVEAVEWDSGTSGYHLEEFLKDIAPYVHHGSYLKFHDQYGDLTAYRFRDGEVKIETISMKEEDDE